MGTAVSAGALFRALAPELMLSGGAMALLLATVWTPQLNDANVAEGAERTGVITRLAMVLCLLVALVVMIAWGDGVPGSADLRIAGDGFRWGIDLAILLGASLALMLLDAEHDRSGAFSPEVPVLLLLAVVGMMVLAAARDLMLVFLGVELMSLSIYVLTGVNRRSPRGAEAAVKYFILGAVSTAFLLYGIALIYGGTGSTRFVDIAKAISVQSTPSVMLLVGMGLLLVGFAFKIAAAPFHQWAPDVYDGAPLPITAFMSACVKTAAFAVFARVMIEALPGLAPKWHAVLWWLSVLTMMAGNVFALSQKNVVRLLAYSSIAHAGYLLVAIVTASTAGTSALVFYTISYTLATMGAFAVLIAVNGGRDRSPTIDDLAGLWAVRPALAVSMAVFLFAFLGMPLVGGMGFFAKFYLLQAALQTATPQTILAVLVVVSSAVSAAYYFGVVSAMFLRPRDSALPPVVTLPMTQGVIIAVAAAILLFGVYPTPVMELARRALPVSTTPPDPAAPRAGARTQAASFQR